MGVTIRATLGSKLISNAATFFRNDPATAICEMVQNCRRAGATAIKFEIDGDDLVVEDDGTGLAKEDAEVLLALGSSANGGGVERDEAAAGIGFFALSHHTVHVRTQDWRCTITPDDFIGRGEVAILDGMDDHYGMRVRIEGFLDGSRPIERAMTASTIAAAVVHSGLRARIVDVVDGTTSDVEPEPFLDCLRLMEGYVAGPVAEMPGLRMRYVRHIGHDEDDGRHHCRLVLNFHGKKIVCGPDCGRFADPFPSHDVVDALGRDGDGLARISRTTMRNIVLVDVQNVASLRLRLPDRDAVIDEPGLEPIAAMARSLMVGAIAANGLAHGLHPSLDPALHAATRLVPARGRDGDDLLSRPDPGDPRRTQVVDMDGLPVERGSLLAVGRSPSIDAFMPHVLRTLEGDLVRLVDLQAVEDLALDGIDAVEWTRIAIEDGSGGETSCDRFHDGSNDWDDGDAFHALAEGSGPTALEGARVVVTMTTDRSRTIVQRLPSYAIGDAGSGETRDLIILKTPGLDAGELAERCATMAMDAVDAMDEDEVLTMLDFANVEDLELHRATMAGAWGGFALSQGDDPRALIEQIGAMVATALNGSGLDQRALDLRLRIGRRPGHAGNVKVTAMPAQRAPSRKDATKTRSKKAAIPSLGPALQRTPAKRRKRPPGKVAT